MISMPVSALVLATNNRGKLAEFERLLAPHGIVVYPQSKFIADGADETGATFRENALLKARHAAKAAGLPAIADDSGLEVDALGGAPGIHSARYAGERATDKENNDKLVSELTDVPELCRAARYRCVLSYVRHVDDLDPVLADGIWEGRILMSPRGSGGFGYDPLFLPNDSSLTVAEMNPEAKNAVSHRGKALRALMERLIERGEIRG